jgi:dihydroneopterin triphosphate diphosphatase
MTRAPFQVLVFPFKKINGRPLFAIFSRSADGKWQGIAGGGENSETPMQAAQRESNEEGNIPFSCSYIQLQTISSVPVNCFRDSHLWGKDLYIIPEYSFGVDVGQIEIKLSTEHNRIRWENYSRACDLLSFDSNKIALWELNQRLLGLGPRDA